MLLLLLYYKVSMYIIINVICMFQDVTQKSLCDPGSVDLVEKCARFHIHCTARLCELEVQGNNEFITIVS